MKTFYKGDIIVKEEDATMKWAVASRQLFYVISTIKKVDGHILIKRPFLNHIKYALYSIFASS